MRKLRITIGNKSWDVTVEDLTDAGFYPGASAAPPVPAVVPPLAPASTPQATLPVAPQPPTGSGAVISPMAGVIKSVLVKQSDQVKQGQALIVLEAMKMENHIAAHVAGTVKTVHVKEGDSVREGHALLELD